MMVSHTISAASGLVFGALVFAKFISPPPPVEIMEVEVDILNQVVWFDRIVHSSRTIRGGITNDVVNVATERSVFECLKDTRTDYGPREPQRQSFTFAFFTTSECMAALEPGAVYEIVSTVTPPGGEASTMRSNRFQLPPKP